MKILLVHNFYQQPGGEDDVFRDEGRLLEKHGHQVERFTVHNDQIKQMGHLALSSKMIWNRESGQAISRVVREYQPAVVHFHNTFPLVSPAGYAAARAHGSAVVQTLHNFRLLCLNALFMREEKACEKCLGHSFAWAGIRHGCYRNSRSASGAVAIMQAAQRFMRKRKCPVDLYIAMSEFARQKFIQGGLPADRIVVKPNFVDSDPEAGTGSGNYAVFVGRLSPEKGIEVLLKAWEALGSTIPLKIVGDGPMADVVKTAQEKNPAICWLGRKSPAEVLEIVGQAAFLVLPSLTYEGCPRVIAEAFAKGTPAVVSNHGPLPAFVSHGITGRVFTPGDAESLAEEVRLLLADPGQLARMRVESRDRYLAYYTSKQNYIQLMDVYDRAIAASKTGVPETTMPITAKAGTT